MPIRGVLFDVGGLLDTEVTPERLIDVHICAAFAAADGPAGAYGDLSGWPAGGGTL